MSTLTGDTFTSSHTALRKVELRGPGGVHLRDLPVLGGSVTGAYGQPVRWSCQFDVAPVDHDGTDLIPRKVGDLLDPLGPNELWCWAGAVVDGQEQWLPWGRFIITDAQRSRDANGVTLSITGEDRSERISSQGWVLPYQSSSGSVVTAVTNLILDRWPDAELDLSDMTGVVNSQVYTGSAGSDPWRDAVSLAAATGHDLALDLDGVIRARPVPDPANATPVRQWGHDGLRVLTRIEQPRTRKGVHTGVVVYAQDARNNAVYYAVVWDENPASPTYSGMQGGTYVGSPLGLRPKWVDADRAAKVGNQATAEQLAAAELRRMRGWGDRYEVAVVPDPTIQVGSIVAAQFDRESPMETCFVERITLPWRVGEPMTCTLSTTRPVDPT